MSTIKIGLPSKLKIQVTSVARKLGITPDHFVREAVEARLKEGTTASPSSLYDLSRDLCGSVAGEPPDLARNMAHLKGYGSWKR